MFKLLFIAIFVVGNEAKRSLSEDSRSRMWEQMRPDVTACLEELGLDPEDLKTWGQQQDLDEGTDHCFVGCVLKRRGTIDDSGKFDMDKAVELQKELLDDEEELKLAYETIQPCTSVNFMEVSDGTEGCDRGRLLFKCLREETIKRHELKHHD